jgi:hypothetical protein
MTKQPWFFALWALVAFWAWAVHVATGFMNNLITSGGGKRSAIVGALDNVTAALLVRPFGQTLSVVLLVAAGIGSAAWIYKWKSRAADDHGNR